MSGQADWWRRVTSRKLVSQCTILISGDVAALHAGHEVLDAAALVDDEAEARGAVAAQALRGGRGRFLLGKVRPLPVGR